MFEELGKIEDVIYKLEQANSLFSCMMDNYFCVSPSLDEDALTERKIQAKHLIKSFNGYTNTMYVIRDIIESQAQSLMGITDILYSTYRELKKLAEQNLELLDGGDSNG